jgi:hypothetical protein
MRSPRPRGLGNQVIEILVVTQARIDAEMVGGVVAVGARGEDRSERDARGAELHGVIQPADDPA